MRYNERKNTNNPNQNYPKLRLIAKAQIPVGLYRFQERCNMKDHGVALSKLGQQAMFVSLTPEQEQRVLELIAEITAIFNHQAKKAS
jgi:hypothetical protein